MNQEEPKRGDFAKKKGEIVLREHEYDGIQEYDQKLPNWWLFTFYGAIVWFIVYWLLYYQFPVFKTDDSRLTSRMEKVFEVQKEELEKTLSEIDDSTLVHVWATDPEIVAAGKESYSLICKACHAEDLSATMTVGGNKIPLPGIALNDGEWKFGGKPLEIFKMINEGSPPDSDGNNGVMMQAKGGASLTTEQVLQVTAYLISELPEEFQDIPAP